MKVMRSIGLGWVEIRRLGLLAYGVAVVSGLLMALTPAPLNAWPLAWIALAPLWAMVQGLGSRAWPLALVFGLVYHGSSLVWIRDLHPLMWMGIPEPASIAIVLSVWLFITFWGAAFGAIWAWGFGYVGRLGLSGPGQVLIGTALWCLTEGMRSHTGLDWTSLSYTQSPGNRVILHLGQISGNLTVTAAIVAVNGFIAQALLAAGPWSSVVRSIRAKEWEILGDRLGRSLVATLRHSGLWTAAVLVLTTHLMGWSLLSQPLETKTEQAIHVGIVQGNVPTRIKLSAQGQRQSLRAYTEGYETLAAEGMDVVLTSEAALPFTWPTYSPTALQTAIEQRHVPIWLGAFGREEDHTTQTLFSIDGNGAVISQYDKVKLVPLGESLPFEAILGGFIQRLSPMRGYLTPGEVGQNFLTPFGQGAIGICYESAFPDIFRRQVKDGATFLATASNLDPYEQTLMAQHWALDMMRAIETDRWLVRATNTGYSGAIDPHGRSLWRSPAHTFVAHGETIYRRQTTTPYVRFGNWLTPLLLLVSGGVVLTRRA
jgi:apolipoprotein N-acyltransferase